MYQHRAAYTYSISESIVYVCVMNGTTSLDDLPAAATNNEPAVQLHVSEENSKVDMSAYNALQEERNKLTQPGPQNGGPGPLSEDMSAKLVQGLQEASKNGGLDLPSSSVPIDESAVKMDQEARANFVPEAPKDYIGNSQTTDEIIRHAKAQQHKADLADNIYEELHAPVMIAIMFFVFMMPSVRSFLFRSFPFLLQNDGNPTIGGYAYTAFLFGGSFWVLNKILKPLSQI